MQTVQAGLVYHVLNRGNGRMALFHKDADFGAFEKVLAEGLERYPVDLLTYCLMGNHWHLVVVPRTTEPVIGVSWQKPENSATLSDRRSGKGAQTG